MKRFVVLLSFLFCGFAFADTETINWYVDGNSYATTTCQTGGDIILPNTPYKYGYTFQGWSHNYVPIEYLESTGTQYIDTGIIPTDTTLTEIRFELLQIPSHSYATLFGAYKNQNDSSAGYALFLNYTIPIQARTGNNTNPNIKSDYPVEVGKYNVSLEFNKLTVNGRDFYPQNYNTWDNIYNTIYLFTLNSQDRLSGRNTTARVYYFKIYNNKVLIRDFIPVLDEMGVPCMFDKVTNQFFYNAGTGTFIAGPTINQ